MDKRIKIIKNKTDYAEALSLLEELITSDPKNGTEEAEKLSILAILIEEYECRNFPLDIPCAIDAIRFRMDQLGLKPADLIPYIGSASRVSEILSGKRNLTIDMINSLSTGLNIPEKALLKKHADESDLSNSISSKAYKQMKDRGYFLNTTDVKNKATTLNAFFSRFDFEPQMLFRKSRFRTDERASHYAIVAWASRVLEKADSISSSAKYCVGSVDLNYMRDIVRLSADDNNGVNKAINKLLSDGIKVIIEPQLDGSKLDGVTILENKDSPVIGLTLRYDRLDNFWFTLMHELAHIANDFNSKETFLYDDFDIRSDKIHDIEKKADNLASEALVDSSKWEVSPARLIPSPLTATALANELGIHPAIVAGKMRYESGNWKYLSSTIKQYTIRDKFKEVKW